MRSTTSFETVLQEAGNLVGFHDLQTIQDKLKQEYVIGVWQLAYLDSIQWASLGAPVGLSAALKHLLQNELRHTAVKSELSDVVLDEKASEPCDRGRTLIFQDHDPHVQNKTPDDAGQSVSGRVGRDTVFSSPISQPPSTIPDTTPKTQSSKQFASISSASGILREGRCLGKVRIVDIVFPYFQRKNNRAILREKSASEVRSFAYRKAEMLFFMSALVSGVVADLWDGFPENEHEFLPRGFHIAFHLGIMWTLGLSLGLTALNIVMILMSCAVEVTKFKEFYKAALKYVQMIDFSMLVLVYLVLFDLFLLTYARVGEAVLGVQDRTIACVCCGIVFCILALLMVFTSYLYNDVARFIFHGGLIRKGDTCLDIPESTALPPQEPRISLMTSALDNLENSAEHGVADSNRVATGEI